MKDYTEFLAKPYSDENLSAWMKEAGIQEQPKLDRGETSAFISNKPNGIELTFEDADSVNVQKEYPEGTLLLTNIRFYGVQTDDFSEFDGALPFGVEFGQLKSQILSRLPPPDWTSSNGKQVQWESNNYWFRCIFNDDDRLEISSIECPMVL